MSAAVRRRALTWAWGSRPLRARRPLPPPGGRGIEDIAVDLPEEVYARLSRLLRAMTAPDLDALAGAMSDQVYEDMDGVYTALPRWGEETEAVRQQIAVGCESGDIVS